MKHRALLWMMAQVPVNHLSGDVKETTEYMNLESQGVSGLEMKSGED